MASYVLNTMLNTVLGACSGLTGAISEEKSGLAQTEGGDAGPEPKSMFGSLTDRVRSIAGVEAPDPAFEAALKLLAEPALLSYVEKGSSPEMARFTASADGSMLTWQCLENISNMPKFSGAISLSGITRVERPPVSVISSWLSGPRSYAIVIYTAAEQVRVEAGSEQQRNEYATALDLVATKLRTRHTADKSDRKIARHAAKEMDMMSKRHTAEKRYAPSAQACYKSPCFLSSAVWRLLIISISCVILIRGVALAHHGYYYYYPLCNSCNRKQEILDSMNSNGGMKHTAVAMASRS
jgi:hypothetical protein